MTKLVSFSLKTFLEPAQNQLLSWEIYPENSHKINQFLPNIFSQICSQKVCKFPTKSSVFYTNLPQEIVKFCYLSDALYRPLLFKMNLILATKCSSPNFIEKSVQYLESQYMIDYPATIESNHV